jgi:hypothetical protein
LKDRFWADSRPTAVAGTDRAVSTGLLRASAQAKALLIKVALAGGKIEIVTMAETFQDRLDVCGELKSLK